MAEDFASWAIVELMGHVRMAGKVSEVELFGSKMGRIDLPTRKPCEDCKGSGADALTPPGKCPLCGGAGTEQSFITQYFGGQSVYRMTPTTEETARRVAGDVAPEPVHLWELPRPQPTRPVREHVTGFDEDEDELMEEERNL